MKKNSARIILSLFALSLLTLFQNCGGAGGAGDINGATSGNWYYHFDCNGDMGCLSTNPTGNTYGDLNEGPVYAACSGLLYFANINWGGAATSWCDNSPTGSVGGGGTGGLSAPTVTGITPSSGAPNITYPQIQGTNFPSSTSGVTASYCGRSIPVQYSSSNLITVKIPYMPSCKSPITLTTAAGTVNTPAFTVINKFRSVTASGSLIVLTGDYGTIMTSINGINWTPRASGMTPEYGGLNASNWNGSQFMVAGDNGYTYRSTDGISWNPIPRNGISTQSLIWSGSQYMSSGAGGYISTSPDGGSWTYISPSNNDIYYSLAYNGSKYVVAGQNAIYRSSNATTWTNIQSPMDSQRRAVGWNGSVFMVVGPNGAFLTSSDGVEWLQGTMSQSYDLYAITSSGSQFVAVGESGTIVTDSGWVTRSSGTGQHLYGVVWTGSMYVAVGASNTIVTSPDGITWTVRSAF